MAVEDTGDGRGEDAIDGPAMMIDPRQLFQGMAEGGVADIVQQGSQAQQLIVGPEMGDQGKDAEGVLQATEGVRHGQIGSAAVMEKMKPAQRPGGQQGLFDRAQLGAKLP